MSRLRWRPGCLAGGGEEQLTDELIGQVVSVVRPVRPDGHGQGWAELEACREQITAWVGAGVVFTACFSRFMFVYLTFSMTLEEVIAGCEAVWAFFGGVFAVVVPDNMSPVVADADAVSPRLTREWLEYAQARGFVTDPARVHHPRDKPRVKAGVKYVQGTASPGKCSWTWRTPGRRCRLPRTWTGLSRVLPAFGWFLHAGKPERCWRSSRGS
jgi:hypothetical protein